MQVQRLLTSRIGQDPELGTYSGRQLCGIKFATTKIIKKKTITEIPQRDDK